MSLPVIILLLVSLVACAILCIVRPNLIKAAIWMMLMSGILSLVMFLMGAHLAAAFELSVCAGLIPVIFISASSMTKITSREEQAEKARERARRFALLPVILITLATALFFVLWPHVSELLTGAAMKADASTPQQVLWDKRQLDLVGQVIIVLLGVYADIVFFKGVREK
ncbi:MAG TPA: NADH-quinone oxidoreductase subunit J [Feifaniaceae bacterium]|nr:NADH-quinone oxidoreductase subunit J [Feifaniaceae bacterium]